MSELREALKRAAETEPILQFFVFAHLSPAMQATAAEFAGTALFCFETLPRNPERTVALRKLLEAKDAAVRSRMYQAAPTRSEPL